MFLKRLFKDQMAVIFITAYNQAHNCFLDYLMYVYMGTQALQFNREPLVLKSPNMDVVSLSLARFK